MDHDSNSSGHTKGKDLTLSLDFLSLDFNQASIVRYTASVCETFFPAFLKKTFSAELSIQDPEPDPVTDTKKKGQKP